MISVLVCAPWLCSKTRPGDVYWLTWSDSDLMIGQLFAGVGLGLLVGMLVGLSSSPVVAVVVGALAGGMVTLLGFVRPAKDGEPAYGQGSVVRLGGFGVACAAAVLFGLAVRTHSWASPSLAEQVAAVQSAGYTPEEARRWVANKNGTLIELAKAGVEQPGPSVDRAGSEKSAGKAAGVVDSVLFAGENSGECQYFDTKQYTNDEEHLNALRLAGGKYAVYAERISKMDVAEQKKVLESLALLACPH